MRSSSKRCLHRSINILKRPNPTFPSDHYHTLHIFPWGVLTILSSFTMSPPPYAMTPEELVRLCTYPKILSLDCPAGAPPHGQMPLNLNGPTVIPLLLGIIIAGTSLVILPLGIRIYTRHVIMEAFAIEDLLIVLATLAYLGFLIGIFSAFPYRLGHHFWDTSISDLYKILPRQ